MLDENSLDQFAENLKNELGLHSLRLYITRNNDIKLDMLAVPKDNRKNGLGTKAMNALCDMADREQRRIILTVGQRNTEFGTTSASRLYDFYKRFGFVKNAGRYKDFTIIESMYRNPRPQPKLRESMKNLSFKTYLINEMPLPVDWDKSTFNNNTSFAKQIRYAKERSQQVGAGSSRVAFVLPFEGRQTVLKIAKNAKGLAQNEHESEKFSDWYLKDLEITIPMIDYDEESNRPTWIHTEFATKAKDSDFVRNTGGLNLAGIIKFAEMMAGRNKTRQDDNKFFEEWEDKLEDNHLVRGLVELIGNYDIPSGDFTRLANWGIYNGNPVIIDLGLSNEIMTSLYSPKRQNVW